MAEADYRERLTVAPLATMNGRHAPDSAYVVCWLGVLGPTATLAWTMLAQYANAGGGTLDVDDLARTLGVGHKHGTNSPMSRALTRLRQFQVASYDEATGTFKVRTALPDVPQRFVPRMSRTALACHHRLTAPPPVAETADLRPALGVGL